MRGAYFICDQVGASQHDQNGVCTLGEKSRRGRTFDPTVNPKQAEKQQKAKAMLPDIVEDPKKKETRSSGVCCEGLFSKWVVMTEPAVPTQPTFILRRNQHQMEGHRSTGSKNTVPNKVNSEKNQEILIHKGQMPEKVKI